MIVGRSVRGRTLEATERGSGTGGLLVFGAIHGDEPASAELCRRFAAAPDDGARVVVVPVVNPDGLARGRKNNAHDVDLNRNFAALNWTREHAPGYFAGANPLSEPESRALAQLVDALAPGVMVAVHQPFQCVNWDGPAEALANAMSAACGYPAKASIGYPTPGSFGSWCGVDRGLPVITLELPRTVEERDYAGCLAALNCAKMAASVA